MKRGINWDVLSSKSIDETVELFLRYGFDSTFIFSNHPDVHEVLPKLKAAGITCESCHAPFKGINSMWARDESGEEMLAELMEGVEVCAEYGVPVLVVHLSSGDHAPGVNDTGLERYDRLISFAREKGVQIAFENQRKLGNIAVAMERYPDAGFCRDVGHEVALSEGIDFMSLFGKRIVALHLHDNRAFHNADDHLFPYDGKIDMEQAAKKLAKSGYGKAIMLEVSGNEGTAYRHLSAEEYLSRAAAAAKRFAEQVEA